MAQIQAVTNEWRDGGFGEQYLTIMNAIVYAAIHNWSFIYSPISEMWYKIHDPEYIRKYEELINVIGHFPLNLDVALQKRVGMNGQMTQEYFDANTDFCTNHPAFKEIQEWFFEGKSKSNYFNGKNLHIAIHIRRNQKVEDGSGIHFHFSDRIYLKMIESLRKKYAGDSPLFHIYSIGDETHFRNVFHADDIVLHINESVQDTFSAMALADVLLIACSGLSQAAGLISKSIVYNIPYWHGAKSHWISWETLYPLNLPRLPISMRGKNNMVDI